MLLIKTFDSNYVKFNISSLSSNTFLVCFFLKDDILFSGAYLVPYFILLILIGIPLFFLELAVGQRIRRGSIGVWNYVYPRLGGIGVSSLMVSKWRQMHAVISQFFHFFLYGLDFWAIPVEVSQMLFRITRVAVAIIITDHKSVSLHEVINVERLFQVDCRIAFSLVNDDCFISSGTWVANELMEPYIFDESLSPGTPSAWLLDDSRTQIVDQPESAEQNLSFIIAFCI